MKVKRATATAALSQSSRRTLHIIVAISMLVGLLTVVPMQAAQAATNTMTLRVISARTEPFAPDGTGSDPVTKGDPVSGYKWMINVDNTGTTEQRSPDPGTGCSATDPGYPDSCAWTSIGGMASSSPIAQTTSGDWAMGTQADLANGIDLPDGRYLISVLADGYKLDGAHFSIPLAGSGPNAGEVTVELQPTPVPTGTIKAQVFADTTTNSTYDDNEDPLRGFKGLLTDILGQVTTDVFGNPLCTTYVRDTTPPIGPNGYQLDADGAPIVSKIGAGCFSGADGVLTIPNMGTDRYALSVIPPDGQNWIQTTTLEGTHDHDVWPIEGDTGLDSEFAVAGESFPAVIFGFVPAPTASMNNGFLSRQGYHPRGTESSTTFCGPYTTRCWRSPDLTSTNRTGVIRGVIDDVKYYVGPGEGTLPEIGIREGGKTAGPIDRPWVALNSVDLGDTIVWIGRGDANGRFRIPQLPAGNYTITWWDEPQDYQLSTQNVTVGDGATGRGENVNLGVMALNGWWTVYDGYVFSDINRNGVKDPGEAGVPNYTLTLRKRDNSLMDRGTNTATTDQDGYYKFEAGYPTTQWFVLEAYNDSYYTTGVTYQSDNQPDPTTILDPGVDINTLPIIGLSGRVDWGVHAYDPTGATGGVDPRNGGIVGTVSYDTTRNELDPRYAAVEDWQPGVSGLTVDLYTPVDCPEGGTERLLATCDADGFYAIDPATGAYETDKLINTYVTETWENPTGCVARDVNGDPLVFGQGQAFIHQDPSGPGQQDLSARCLDTFVGGVQFGNNFGASVNGNYGFGDGCFDWHARRDRPLGAHLQHGLHSAARGRLSGEGRGPDRQRR